MPLIASLTADHQPPRRLQAPNCHIAPPSIGNLALSAFKFLKFEDTVPKNTRISRDTRYAKTWSQSYGAVVATPSPFLRGNNLFLIVFKLSINLSSFIALWVLAHSVPLLWIMSAFGPSLLSPPQSSSQQNPTSPPTQPSTNPDPSIYAHQKWASSGHGPQHYLARLPTVTPIADAGSSKSTEIGIPRPKRKRITPEQLEVLSSLFEYTDTPTFDLREAIGAKLGMSNREVQVWFQNRRAKVNRQRPSTNLPPLSERCLPLTSQSSVPQLSPPDQDSHRKSHRRPKSSSSEHLLPGVSSILNSPCNDASSSTYSVAPLLPPFQPTGPEVRAIHEGQPHRSAPGHSRRGHESSSPGDTLCPDRRIGSEPHPRHCPSVSHRRIAPGTSGFPYSRTWLPRRSREPDLENVHHPRRVSTDPQLGMIVNHPSQLRRTRWSSSCLSATSSLVESQEVLHDAQPPWLGLASTGPSSSLDPCVVYNNSALPIHSRGLTLTPENPTAPLEPPVLHQPRAFAPNHASRSISVPSSRSASPPSKNRPQSHGHCRGDSAPSSSITPGIRKRQDGKEPFLSDSGLPLNRASSSSGEEPVLATTRSLFAGRCLPPLPNPVQPGPGSFPPPAALRVVPKKYDRSPALSTQASSCSSSEFKLPPLL